MTDPAFEQRVAAAIARFADQAPMDVEALTMTRLAAAGSRRIGPVWFGTLPAGRGLVVAVALLGLFVTVLAGAFVAGGYVRERGLLAERSLVEPFIGLPPEGATPSTPETGELVLSFDARVRDIALDVHRMWVYGDGRLIWVRNLDYDSGFNAGQVTESDRSRAEILARPAFDGRDPIRAVIEQRLTSEGVDLVRTEVLKTAHISGPFRSGQRSTWGLPGVLWGDVTLGDGEQRRMVSWSDPALPGRLADLGSWLPASAWSDQRISAFVPSRYAVCIESLGSTARIPDSIRSLIESHASEVPIDSPEHDPRCPYRVPTAVARTIVAALQAALPPVRYATLRYAVASDPGREDGSVELLPVLPNGDLVCNCG